MEARLMELGVKLQRQASLEQACSEISKRLNSNGLPFAQGMGWNGLITTKITSIYISIHTVLS
jgi:hypothetical protein